MKKIFGIILVGGLFLSVHSVHAANKAPRFRGSSATRYYENVEQFARKITSQTLPQYSRFRSTSRIDDDVLRGRAVTEAPRAESNLPVRKVSRALTFSQGRGNVIQSRLEEAGKLEQFTAENIFFRISLPKGFQKAQDTIRWDSGEMIFEREPVRVKLAATAKRCDGGIAFVRNCLREAADSALKNFKLELPPMEMVTNESISLDPGQVQQRKQNIAWYIELFAQDYHAALLTFFDPVNEYLWIMKLLDPGQKQNLLDNKRTLHQIFASLLPTTDVNKKGSAVGTTTPASSDKSLARTRDKQPVTFGTKEVNRFVATKVPFYFELPKGFELLSDTLDWRAGSLEFESPEATLQIQATELVCDDQTPNLKRACIEKHAASFAIGLQAEFEGESILQDENTQLKLVDPSLTGEDLQRTSSVQTDVARFFLVRLMGQRIAQLTFATPNTGNIWKMEIRAPEEREQLLNDVRQYQKVFSSLRFRMAEEAVE